MEQRTATPVGSPSPTWTSPRRTHSTSPDPSVRTSIHIHATAAWSATARMGVDALILDRLMLLRTLILILVTLAFLPCPLVPAALIESSQTTPTTPSASQPTQIRRNQTHRHDRSRLMERPCAIHSRRPLAAAAHGPGAQLQRRRPLAVAAHGQSAHGPRAHSPADDDALLGPISVGKSLSAPVTMGPTSMIDERAEKIQKAMTERSDV